MLLLAYGWAGYYYYFIIYLYENVKVYAHFLEKHYCYYKSCNITHHLVQTKNILFNNKKNEIVPYQ